MGRRKGKAASSTSILIESRYLYTLTLLHFGAGETSTASWKNCLRKLSHEFSKKEGHSWDPWGQCGAKGSYGLVFRLASLMLRVLALCDLWPTWLAREVY